MNRETLITQYIESQQNLLRAWKSRMTREMTDETISPALVHILFILERDQPLTSREIADELRVTPGAVAQFIEQLLENGFIVRTQDKQDKRKQLIRLSEAGVAKLTELHTLRRKMFNDVAELLSDDELAESIRITEKISTTFK